MVLCYLNIDHRLAILKIQLIRTHRTPIHTQSPCNPFSPPKLIQQKQKIETKTKTKIKNKRNEFHQSAGSLFSFEVIKLSEKIQFIPKRYNIPIRNNRKHCVHEMLPKFCIIHLVFRSGSITFEMNINYVWHFRGTGNYRFRYGFRR